MSDARLARCSSNKISQTKASHDYISSPISQPLALLPSYNHTIMTTLAAHHALSTSLHDSTPFLVHTDSTDPPLDSPLSECIVTPLHSQSSSPVIRSSTYQCNCSRRWGHDDTARFFKECDPFVVADNDEDQEGKGPEAKQAPSSPPPTSFQYIATDIQKVISSPTPPNTVVGSPDPSLTATITNTNSAQSSRSTSSSQPSQRLMGTLSSLPLPFCSSKPSHRPHLHISTNNEKAFSRSSLLTSPVTFSRPALPFGVSAYYLAKPELAKRRRFGDSKQDVALSAVLLNRESKTYTAPIKFKIEAQLDGSLLERDLKDVPSKRRNVSLSAYEYKQSVKGQVSCISVSGIFYIMANILIGNSWQWYYHEKKQSFCRQEASTVYNRWLF